MIRQEAALQRAKVIKQMSLKPLQAAISVDWAAILLLISAQMRDDDAAQVDAMI